VKLWQLQDWSIDRLALVEQPRPEPGPGQALVRMKAASLNYRDLVVPRRGYGERTGSLPLVPVSDGVGEVVAVGQGVSRVAPGERVCPAFFQGWIAGAASAERLATGLGGPLDGVMAEYRLFGEQGLCKAPAHLSDEEAATLPCAALTAWSAIVEEGRVRPGDKVLVQGTGGVSLFALQFARLCGAEVIVLSGSDAKLARARELGAAHGVNYRSDPEWARTVRRLAGGDGVDHVVEVGGAQSMPQSVRAVRAGGTVSLIGVASGPVMQVPLGHIVTRSVRLQGITVGSRDRFEAMLRAIAQHALRPVVDRVFGFAELRAALDALAGGAHFGQICIRIGRNA
jgi:NADPH:quinone reductase-like Zn-dependent oxidoreductase